MAVIAAKLEPTATFDPIMLKNRLLLWYIAKSILTEVGTLPNLLAFGLILELMQK